MLLDTCTLLWLVGAQERLSERAQAALEDHAGRLFVSAISAFEIGLKHQKGKLVLPLDPGRWYARALELHGLRELPVDGTAAIHATLLPPLHRDPADRILVATAQLRKLAILTPDPLIRAYPDTATIW